MNSYARLSHCFLGNTWDIHGAACNTEHLWEDITNGQRVAVCVSAHTCASELTNLLHMFATPHPHNSQARSLRRQRWRFSFLDYLCITLSVVINAHSFKTFKDKKWKIVHLLLFIHFLLTYSLFNICCIFTDYLSELT